jgi:glycerophosphoryl diester phosphodiesterase
LDMHFKLLHMYKLLILLSCLIITLSCSKENFDVANLNGNEISAFGHGGMGTRSTYPINTYESLMKCLNFGSDGTELDIQMTKDSVLIAFHDIDLSESTNISGLVNSLNWSEIKNAHYTDPLYTSYSIISLDQFFSNVINLHEYDFTFDCKINSGNDDPIIYNTKYTNAISQIINKFNLTKNVYIESQSEDFLRLLQQKNSNYKLFIYPNSFNSGLEIATRMNLFGITISTDIVNKKQIEIAHNNNLFVAIWGISSKGANSDGIKKNPDFIQSDKIKNLVDLLD